MSRWPWHRTYFYREWLEDLAREVESDAVQQPETAGLSQAAAWGIEVREV